MTQIMKDKTRRGDVVCNDLARQYRIKASELETKHQQLNQLHGEFETKVQQKEVRSPFPYPSSMVPSFSRLKKIESRKN